MRAARDMGVRFPAAVVKEEVKKGKEPASQTLLSFFAAPITAKLSARIPVRVLMGTGLRRGGRGVTTRKGQTSGFP